MMDLYEIAHKSLSADRLTCQILVNAGHPLFTGHFPSQPIVPGAVMVEMMEAVFHEKWRTTSLILNIRMAKFHEIWNPHQCPEALFQADFHEADGWLDISQAKIFCEGRLIFSCQARLKPEDGLYHDL